MPFSYSPPLPRTQQYSLSLSPVFCACKAISFGSLSASLFLLLGKCTQVSHSPWKLNPTLFLIHAGILILLHRCVRISSASIRNLMQAFLTFSAAMLLNFLRSHSLSRIVGEGSLLLSVLLLACKVCFEGCRCSISDLCYEGRLCSMALAIWWRSLLLDIKLLMGLWFSWGIFSGWKSMSLAWLIDSIFISN